MKQISIVVTSFLRAKDLLGNLLPQIQLKRTQRATSVKHLQISQNIGPSGFHVIVHITMKLASPTEEEISMANTMISTYEITYSVCTICSQFADH